MAAVRDVLPRLCLADDRDLPLRPTRLGSKGAAVAPLAIQTVTDRHANRLSFASSLKLSAAACRGSALYGHARIPCPVRSTNDSRRSNARPAGPAMSSTNRETSEDDLTFKFVGLCFLGLRVQTRLAAIVVRVRSR